MDNLVNDRGLFEALLREHRKILQRVTQEEIDHLVRELDEADKVFCAAQGRSGYVLRCFCMRLMQLGYRAFFVGETITPNIEGGDLLIVLSGSGQTSLTLEWVKMAREQHARSFGIVGIENSLIGRAVQYSLLLPAGSKLQPSTAFHPAQPPGSLFEQAAFILLEAVVLVICQKKGFDPGMILERHANLE